MALAAGFALALGGCSGTNKPTGDKKDDKKTDPTLSINPSTTPGTTPSVTPPVDPPKPPERIDFNSPIYKEAETFLKALMDGTARYDRLTTGFVKAIGLPAELPADKAKGFSADTAEGWLKRAGQAAVARGGFFPPIQSRQIGDVALFRGPFNAKDTGGYALRLVMEAGSWKVDWFSMTSVSPMEIVGGDLVGDNGDNLCQQFAATAVTGLLFDKDTVSRGDRALVLATGLTPTLKKKWAEPLDSDKGQGFDYNPGLLGSKASEFATGVEKVSVARPGADPNFRVEVTKAGGAKAAYLLKLVKGPGPGQWLVDDVVPQ
jgi:hypothetical protein